MDGCQKKRKVGLHLLIDEKYLNYDCDYAADIKKAIKKVSRTWEIQFGIEFVIDYAEIWEAPLSRHRDFWDSEEIAAVVKEQLRLSDILIAFPFYPIFEWNPRFKQSYLLAGRVIDFYSPGELNDDDQRVIIAGVENLKSFGNKFANYLTHVISHELGHCFGARDIYKPVWGDSKVNFRCIMSYDYVFSTMRFSDFNKEIILNNKKSRCFRP